jgi:hypothetical protein
MIPAKYGSTVFIFLKTKNLQKASEDFRYLLNRAYARKAALELVGNRYQLTSDQRHLLHRGVFSDTDSKERQKKKISPNQIRGYDLVIDGHNVLITIEAGLSGRPLVLGDDGFIRDISGLSGSFQKTEMTVQALELLLNVLKRAKPHQTLFLLILPSAGVESWPWKYGVAFKKRTFQWTPWPSGSPKKFSLDSRAELLRAIRPSSTDLIKWSIWPVTF